MTDSNPISPPEAASNPLSPVARSSSFPHKTSAATSPTHTHIDTSTPAINEFAVEIDGTAIEDEATLETGGTKGEKSGGLEQLGAGGPGQEKSAHGIGGLVAKGVEGLEGLVGGLLGNRKGDDTLEEQEDVDEEFLGSGERGAGKEVREKRAALLSTRSKDPGVIVDLPQDPTAEEVQAAKSAEGTITPAVQGLR